MSRLVKCRKCGEKIDVSKKECPHCGAVLFTKAHGCLAKVVLSLIVLTIILWITVFIVPSARGFKTVGNAVSGRHTYTTVYTSHTDMDVIRIYADRQSWTPGRFTVIAFYDDKDLTPNLVTAYDPSSYPEEYRKHCIALYIKNSSGEVSFNDLRSYNEKVYE